MNKSSIFSNRITNVSLDHNVSSFTHKVSPDTLISDKNNRTTDNKQDNLQAAIEQSEIFGKSNSSNTEANSSSNSDSFDRDEECSMDTGETSDADNNSLLTLNDGIVNSNGNSEKLNTKAINESYQNKAIISEQNLSCNIKSQKGVSSEQAFIDNLQGNNHDNKELYQELVKPLKKEDLSGTSHNIEEKSIIYTNEQKIEDCIISTNNCSDYATVNKLTSHPINMDKLKDNTNDRLCNKLDNVSKERPLIFSSQDDVQEISIKCKSFLDNEISTDSSPSESYSGVSSSESSTGIGSSENSTGISSSENSTDSSSTNSASNSLHETGISINIKEDISETNVDSPIDVNQKDDKGGQKAENTSRVSDNLITFDLQLKPRKIDIRVLQDENNSNNDLNSIDEEAVLNDKNQLANLVNKENVAILTSRTVIMETEKDLSKDNYNLFVFDSDKSNDQIIKNEGKILTKNLGGIQCERLETQSVNCEKSCTNSKANEETEVDRSNILKEEDTDEKSEIYRHVSQRENFEKTSSSLDSDSDMFEDDDENNQEESSLECLQKSKLILTGDLIPKEMVNGGKKKESVELNSHSTNEPCHENKTKLENKKCIDKNVNSSDCSLNLERSCDTGKETNLEFAKDKLFEKDQKPIYVASQIMSMNSGTDEICSKIEEKVDLVLHAEENTDAENLSVEKEIRSRCFVKNSSNIITEIKNIRCEEKNNILNKIENNVVDSVNNVDMVDVTDPLEGNNELKTMESKLHKEDDKPISNERDSSFDFKPDLNLSSTVKFGLRECKVNLSQSKISESILISESQNLLLDKPNFCKLKRKLEDMLETAQREEEKAGKQLRIMREEKLLMRRDIVVEIKKVKKKFRL